MGLILKGASPELSFVESAGSDERRVHDRFEVTWAVDCVADDTFLYASLANISEMGIFVRTIDPLAVGTRVWLSFSPPGHESFKLEGEVAWINRVRPNGDNINPGMGVRFVDLKPEERERLVEVIRAIAYVRDPEPVVDDSPPKSGRSRTSS